MAIDRQRGHNGGNDWLGRVDEGGRARAAWRKSWAAVDDTFRALEAAVWQATNDQSESRLVCRRNESWDLWLIGELRLQNIITARAQNSWGSQGRGERRRRSSARPPLTSRESLPSSPIQHLINLSTAGNPSCWPVSLASRRQPLAFLPAGRAQSRRVVKVAMSKPIRQSLFHLEPRFCGLLSIPGMDLPGERRLRGLSFDRVQLRMRLNIHNLSGTCPVALVVRH